MLQNTFLKTRGGLVFDYGNLYGPGKVTEEDIRSLSDRLADAHRAVETMRSSGKIRGHLSKDGLPEKVLFGQLPYVAEGNINSPGSIKELRDFGATMRGNVDTVISFGIGGSFLGNKVLFDVGLGEFWNSGGAETRDGWPRLYFSGNNLDGARTMALLDEIVRQAKDFKKNTAGRLYKAALVVISKSGSTLETMACFMLALNRLKEYSDIISVEIIAVTDPAEDGGETLLHRLAVKHGWRRFRVPDGVGGRFSVFSDVGLVTAAASGLAIESFLAGARAMDEQCRSDDLNENPALLNAALKYLAAERYGRDIEVFMPYCDSLKSLSEWYIQLLAESLGKTRDRSGRAVYYGRTPVVAVGTTDMHAQTQQHQEGKLDKVVQFVRIDGWQPDTLVPDMFPEEKALAAMAGLPFSEALNAALISNAEALAANGRFSAVFVVPKLDLYQMGSLMYLLALSVAYEGELADVDAFDQPGVESYKRLLGPKLAALKDKQTTNH